MQGCCRAGVVERLFFLYGFFPPPHENEKSQAKGEESNQDENMPGSFLVLPRATWYSDFAPVWGGPS